MFKKILLASDGSESSLRAARHAIALVSAFPEAKVDVIYVVPPIPPQWYSYYAPIDLDIPAIVRKAGEEALASTLQLFQEAGVSVQSLVESGDAAEEICAVAAEHHYDLIIVGRRGLGPLRELALGSVSHKVCQHAKCPVLVVN